jgi:tetratricopeptide (TPR) repeat protein
VDDILIHYIEKAKQYQVARQEKISRFYLSCLEGWSNAPLGYSTERYHPGTQFSEEVGNEIQVHADALVNGWVSTFLQAATNQLKDPQVLQSLPQGISRNFVGALGIVKQALDVMPNNLRLLSFAVKQYNDYTYELAVANQHDQARKVIDDGYLLAHHMGEIHLKEGDSLNPDNQAAYLACHLAYQLENEADKEMAYLQECRRWGGSNEEIELQILRQRARQAMEQEDFDEALGILESAGPRNAQKSEIVRLRAACHFRRGFGVAERAAKLGAQIVSSPKDFIDIWQGRDKEGLETIDRFYKESLQDMQLAHQLDPEQEVIKKNIEQIEEALCESRYHIILGVAYKVLDEDQENFYEAMIEPLRSVPVNSELGNYARNFLSAIHFRLAIRAANVEDFPLGETHMLTSLELDPQDATIKKQLTQLYVAWGFSFVAQARKFYEPLERSIDAFMKEDDQKFRNIQPATAKLLVQAEQKFQVALQRATVEDRVEVNKALDYVRDPKCFYWVALLGATHVALEKDHKAHYKRLGALLLKCPKGNTVKQVANQLAAAIYFREGVEQANNDRLKEAQKSLETAAGLDPDNATIHKQLQAIEDLVREAKPRKAFKEAQNAFEHENYETARRLAESIPKDFSHYNNVRNLLSATYYKLGEAAYHAKNLEEAIGCAEKALVHDPNHTALKENLRHLQTLKAQGGFKAIEDHNKGVEIANNVIKFFEMIPKNKQVLTPDMAMNFLTQLDEAVKLTAGDPDIVHLRDQLRNAIRGY